MTDYMILTPEQQDQARVARLAQLEAEHWGQQLRINELEAVITELDSISDPNEDQAAALAAYQAELELMYRLHKDTEAMMLANQATIPQSLVESETPR